MPLHADALVCLDFDDTLVANQSHFEDAEREFVRLLAAEHGIGADAARSALEQADRGHHHLGRHRNRFLLTLLAAAAAASGAPAIPLGLLPRLLAIAAHPYDAQPEPLPGVRRALARLRAAHPGPLWLLTSGDPVVQAGRVQRSGLAPYFDAVHIVPEKTAQVYAALGRGRPHALMVGNSPRADILPALAAGFAALHVQVPTWAFDLAPLPPGVPRFASFADAVAALL